MPTRALHMRKVRELVCSKYQARLFHEQIAGALVISKGVVAKICGPDRANEARSGASDGEVGRRGDGAHCAGVAACSYGGRVEPDFPFLHPELKRPNLTLTVLRQECRGGERRRSDLRLLSVRGIANTSRHCAAP